MLNSHTTYAAAGMGGAVAIVLSWLAKAVFHTDLPPEVAVSAAAILSAVCGRFLHQLPVPVTGE